ncbi:glycosyltransferase [Streptomyces hirsutus]|uniref:glycosyltransferase n=1 Tax=Streptomyces hirsutus TaxID=35620 RepID=UPI003651074D
MFPRTAAVVHHAGAGTTAAGLRAGVPAVPVPVMADQPFWASRLYELGVAPGLCRSGTSLPEPSATRSRPVCPSRPTAAARPNSPTASPQRALSSLKERGRSRMLPPSVFPCFRLSSGSAEPRRGVKAERPQAEPRTNGLEVAADRRTLAAPGTRGYGVVVSRPRGVPEVWAGSAVRLILWGTAAGFGDT